MTRTEAFQLSVQKGRLIRHKLFKDDSLIEVLPNGNIRYEEGRQIPIWEYLADKQSPEWEIDWEILITRL